MNLIKNFRQAWKLWSVRLAAVTAILATIIAANQSIALGLIYFLPPEGPLRTIVAVVIGIVVFVIPTVTRLMKQKKLESTDVSNTEQ